MIVQKSKKVLLSHRAIGIGLVSAALVGAVQLSLVQLAFFSTDIKALKVAAQTEVDLAKLVIRQCEVFSAINVRTMSNGTREVGCVFDLAYATKLDKMRSRVRKLKRQRKKESEA